MAKAKPKTEEVEDAKSEPTIAAPEIELVKMVRDQDQAPFTADVHPAEVENYKKGGWRVAE